MLFQNLFHECWWILDKILSNHISDYLCWNIKHLFSWPVTWTKLPHSMQFSSFPGISAMNCLSSKSFTVYVHSTSHLLFAKRLILTSNLHHTLAILLKQILLCFPPCYPSHLGGMWAQSTLLSSFKSLIKILVWDEKNLLNGQALLHYYYCLWVWQILLHCVHLLPHLLAYIGHFDHCI